MNLLDLLILALGVTLGVRGWRTGFFRQAGSLGGVALGVLAGAVIAPWLVRPATSPDVRLFIVLVIFLLAIVIGSGLGEMLGITLGGATRRLRLGALDQLLGAGFGAVVSLMLIWTLAATFNRLPSPLLAKQVERSTILRLLDQHLPPVPDVLARVEKLVSPNGFPRVFTGLEPAPAAPVTGPDATAVSQAAAAARASTVEIQGRGCGGVISGSGFSVGPGLVATNAHVVAGLTRLTVFDGAGPHNGTVVSFDPDLDFAVVRTAGLTAPTLPLAPANADRGTVGAVLGYPGGGPLAVDIWTTQSYYVKKIESLPMRVRRPAWPAGLAIGLAAE